MYLAGIGSVVMVLATAEARLDAAFARAQADSISVGDSRPTKRVIFVPWSEPGRCTQATGKFDFTGRQQQIRVWLPEGVRSAASDHKD
jgi:heparin/heparan-sulfate lyase